MNQFGSFVGKEFRHILRDRRTMLILLVMPIVQIVLFGFAISVEIRNINLAVIALHPSEVTRQIVARIDANEYFTVVGELSSAEQIDPLMQREKIDMVLRFGDDFDRGMTQTAGAAAQITIDASNPNTAASEAMYLQGILSAYFAERHSEALTAPVIRPSVRLIYNPRMESTYNFVPGIMGLILFIICAMMTAISIVREKEVGTMEVLLVSPVRPLWIILSKMIPYFVVSCVNLATILLLSYFVLDVPLAGSLFWLCAASLVYIILALAIGLFISTIAQTQIAAMLLSSMAFMLPIIMLSGMIFPIESMPCVLQWISNIIPAKWYVATMRKLMIEGLPLRYVATELTVLSAMAAAMIAVALAKFKNRLE